MNIDISGEQHFFCRYYRNNFEMYFNFKSEKIVIKKYMNIGIIGKQYSSFYRFCLGDFKTHFNFKRKKVVIKIK